MLIKQNKEDLITYLEDTSNIKGNAVSLYIPESKEEVISIIRNCAAKQIPFTISAGRTGTTGGCVAQGGIVVSLERLKQIINLDINKALVSLEAGVSLEELESEINKHGLTFRATPTENCALVGGAVSTSASGTRGFGYGSVRNYVEEIEVAITSGEVLKIKRGQIKAKGRNFDFSLNNKNYKFKLPGYDLPKIKSQAGYFVKDDLDLIDLFIGSEGTLGVILNATLSLQPLPFSIFDGLVFFDKVDQGFKFIQSIREMKAKGVFKPASLEFFDCFTLDMLKSHYSFIPLAEAAVYFEQEAESEDASKKLLEVWANLIEACGASMDTSIIAETAAERAKIFDIRHKVPQLINETLRQRNQVKTACDIAVPQENFSKMLDFYQEQASSSGLEFLNFGHIGEFHTHFNFLPKDDQENAKAGEYMKLFCEKAVSLGGTVSAEHGIGKIKKPYLEIMFKAHEIQEMADLKKQLDPYCILGLDNIFKKELL